jgi:hypothetical protein
MPSTEPQDDGAAEDIQESAEAALRRHLTRDLAAQLALSLKKTTPTPSLSLI